MSNLNEDNKAKESPEQIKNGQDSRLMDEFITEFVESYESKRNTNELEFNQFVDNILDTDTPLDPVYISKLQTFRAKSNKFRHLDISKLNKFDFQAEVFTAGNKLIAERDTLLSRLESEYTLSVEQKSKLKDKIKQLKLAKISSIFKTEKNRKAFVNEVFLENMPTKISHKDFFNKLNIKFESLSEEVRNGLIFFLEEGKFIDTDFIALISENFNPEQKRSLLAMFVSNISLEKLVELKIITRAEAYKQLLAKFDAEYRHIKEKYPIEDDRLKFFSERFSLDNIRVNLKHINDSNKPGIFIQESDVDKILKDEEIIKNITAELESVTREAKKPEKIKSKETFIKKLQGDTELQKKFPEIDKKVGPGTIFAIPHNDEKLKKTIYVKVEALDDNGVIFKTLNHADGILDPDSPDGITEKKELHEYMNFLNYLPKDDTRIIDKKELKAIVKDESIVEYPSAEKVETIEQLERLINVEDPSGVSYKLEPGTVFHYMREGEKLSARIKQVTKDGIAIEGAIHDHPMSFDLFLQAFIAQKANRIGKISNLDEMLQKLKSSGTKSLSEGFRNVAIEKGKFYPDNPELKGKSGSEIVALIGKQNKYAKIESMSDGKITIVEGELINEKIDKKTGKKTGEIKDPQRYTLREDEFYLHAEKNEYKPHLEAQHVHQEEPKNVNVPQNWKFGNWIFSKHSFVTLAAGGTQWMKAITDGLKEGNDLLSANFALGLGGFIPESLRHDLVNRVEGAQKKLMEEIVGRLNIDRVIEIVQTSNASEPQREAALIWTLGKFGHLYGERLNQYRGTFLWYKLMGGRINDPLYNEYMSERRNDAENPTPQVEEALIEELLKRQGKEIKQPDHLPPKRRLNFYKEAKAKMLSGADEKKKDGETDAGRFNTAAGKHKFCIELLTKKGDYNALYGAFQNLLKKGYTAKDLNSIPFIILMSGMSKTWPEKLSNDFKGSIGAAFGLPILECVAAPNDVDMFGRATVALAYTISKDAGDMAKEIDDMKTNKKSETDIVEKCLKFWNKYGDKMTPKFTMTSDLTMCFSEDPNIKKLRAKINVGANKHTLDDEHRKNDVYDANHSFFMAAGGKSYLLKGLQFGLDGNTKTELDRKFVDSIVLQIEYTKTMQVPGPNKATDEETKAYRKKAYAYLSRIIIDAVVEKFNDDKAISNINTAEWYKRIAKRVAVPKTFEQKELYANNESVIQSYIEEQSVEFFGGLQKESSEAVQSAAKKYSSIVQDVLRDNYFSEPNKSTTNTTPLKPKQQNKSKTSQATEKVLEPTG